MRFSENSATYQNSSSLESQNPKRPSQRRRKRPIEQKENNKKTQEKKNLKGKKVLSSEKSIGKKLNTTSNINKRQGIKQTEQEKLNKKGKKNKSSHEKDLGSIRNRNTLLSHKRKKYKKQFIPPPFERRKLDLTTPCIICSKYIKDLFSAFSYPEKAKTLCHFDCAIEKIKETEKLLTGQSLLYIGSGIFAIIKLKKEKGKKLSFEIIKKIEFELKSDDPSINEWRVQLQQK